MAFQRCCPPLEQVFSILVASAWLPFQPMRPVQLLTQVCHSITGCGR